MPQCPEMPVHTRMHFLKAYTRRLVPFCSEKSDLNQASLCWALQSSCTSTTGIFRVNRLEVGQTGMQSPGFAASAIY